MAPKCILIVEPDVTLLQTVAEQILEPQGYKLLKAQNQEEGLSLLRAVTPDLLLLHLPLGAVSSFLTRTVKFGGVIPVIVVVEQTSAQITVELLKLGVRDYVVWPEVPEDVLHAVDRVLAQAPGPQSAANKSALKFEFADMASHLLRNPLHIIQTSIRCLQTLDLTPPEQQNLLDKMWKQSQRLTDFTNELLRMLRLETEGVYINTNPVQLLPLVKQIFDLVQHEKPNLVFSLTAAENLPPVAADKLKVEMVVFNLLLGAIRRCSVGSQISVALVADTPEVQVVVRDNGKPIPVQPLDQVFETYYPVGLSQMNIPSNYHLGLYTTKRLVELQHGRVWARRDKETSEFGFALPVWEVKNDQNIAG